MSPIEKRDSTDAAGASSRSSPDADAAATVALISDFGSGDDRGWNDLRTTLAALARQDFDEPVDVVLVESESMRGRIPEDLFEILPGLRVDFVPADDSYALKNAAIERSPNDIVAILDGDCAPDPSWVRHLVEAMRRHPEVAVVSGRTRYAGDSLLSRAMALAGRAFIERDGFGPTTHITNNGAGFRRSLSLRHPLPLDCGVFASQMQSERMRADGLQVCFDPRLTVFHAYDGWSFERDQRPLLGYGVVKVRLEEERVPFSGVTRLGVLSIPIFVAGRILRSWKTMLRHHRAYDVRAWELPLAFAFVVRGCLWEIPGMWRALRDRAPHETRFR